MKISFKTAPCFNEAKLRKYDTYLYQLVSIIIMYIDDIINRI